MSWEGRRWSDLADKLLDAHPLKFQKVDENDSVMGMWSAEWAGLDAVSYTHLTLPTTLRVQDPDLPLCTQNIINMIYAPDKHQRMRYKRVS